MQEGAGVAWANSIVVRSVMTIWSRCMCIPSTPGDALNYAQTAMATFVKLKIENMQEQHNNLIDDEAMIAAAKKRKPPVEEKDYALIAVAAGRRT